MELPQRLTAIAALTASLALLAGCAGSGGDTDQDGGLEPIAVGIVPAADLAGPYLAEKLGYFEDAGLEVSIEIGAGGAAAVPALESGSLQISTSNIVSLLQGSQQGLGLKCLGGVFVGNETHDLIISAENEGVITDGSDLEGRTVAINSLGNVSEVVMRKWIEQNGGDPAEVEFVALGFPDMPAAVESGQVDVAYVSEPFATISRDAGLAVLDDFPNSAVGQDVTLSCWTATDAWLADHEAEAEAFMTAMARVEEYLAEDPDAVREVVVDEFDIDPAVADRVVLPQITAAVTAEDVQIWLDAARETGIITGEVDATAIDGFSK